MKNSKVGINSYKQFMSSQLKKMFQGQHELTDAMIWWETAALENLTDDDIICSTLLNSLPKAKCRTIEHALYDLVRQLAHAKPAYTFSQADKFLMSKQYDEDEMKTFELVIAEITIFNTVKNWLHNLLSLVSLEAKDTISFFYHVRNHIVARNNNDDVEVYVDNNEVRSTLQLVVLWLSYHQQGGLPLYITETQRVQDWEFVSEGLSREAINYVKTFGRCDWNNLVNLRRILIHISGAFYSRYTFMVGFVNDNCNDFTLHLFTEPTVMSLEADVISNEQSAEMITALQSRKALLPVCGVRLTSDTYTMDIHEFITDDEKLYVLVKSENQLLIYDVMGGGIEVSDTSVCMRTRVEDVLGLSFWTPRTYKMLQLYRQTISFYETASASVEGECQLDDEHKLSEHRRLYDAYVLIKSHTRQLPPGWSASPEAVDSALKIGLHLKDNETYVRQYLKKAHRATFKDSVRRPTPLAISDLAPSSIF